MKRHFTVSDARGNSYETDSAEQAAAVRRMVAAEEAKSRDPLLDPSSVLLISAIATIVFVVGYTLWVLS